MQTVKRPTYKDFKEKALKNPEVKKSMKLINLFLKLKSNLC